MPAGLMEDELWQYRMDLSSGAVPEGTSFEQWRTQRPQAAARPGLGQVIQNAAQGAVRGADSLRRGAFEYASQTSPGELARDVGRAGFGLADMALFEPSRNLVYGGFDTVSGLATGDLDKANTGLERLHAEAPYVLAAGPFGSSMARTGARATDRAIDFVGAATGADLIPGAVTHGAGEAAQQAPRLLAAPEREPGPVAQIENAGDVRANMLDNMGLPADSGTVAYIQRRAEQSGRTFDQEANLLANAAGVARSMGMDDNLVSYAAVVARAEQDGTDMLTAGHNVRRQMNGEPAQAAPTQTAEPEPQMGLQFDEAQGQVPAVRQEALKGEIMGPERGSDIVEGRRRDVDPETGFFNPIERALEGEYAQLPKKPRTGREWMQELQRAQDQGNVQVGDRRLEGPQRFRFADLAKVSGLEGWLNERANQRLTRQEVLEAARRHRIPLTDRLEEGGGRAESINDLDYDQRRQFDDDFDDHVDRAVSNGEMSDYEYDAFDKEWGNVSAESLASDYETDLISFQENNQRWEPDLRFETQVDQLEDGRWQVIDEDGNQLAIADAEDEAIEAIDQIRAIRTAELLKDNPSLYMEFVRDQLGDYDYEMEARSRLADDLRPDFEREWLEENGSGAGNTKWSDYQPDGLAGENQGYFNRIFSHPANAGMEFGGGTAPGAHFPDDAYAFHTRGGLFVGRERGEDLQLYGPTGPAQYALERYGSRDPQFIRNLQRTAAGAASQGQGNVPMTLHASQARDMAAPLAPRRQRGQAGTVRMPFEVQNDAQKPMRRGLYSREEVRNLEREAEGLRDVRVDRANQANADRLRLSKDFNRWAEVQGLSDGVRNQAQRYMAQMIDPIQAADLRTEFRNERDRAQGVAERAAEARRTGRFPDGSEADQETVDSVHRANLKRVTEAEEMIRAIDWVQGQFGQRRAAAASRRAADDAAQAVERVNVRIRGMTRPGGQEAAPDDVYMADEGIMRRQSRGEMWERQAIGRELYQAAQDGNDYFALPTGEMAETGSGLGGTEGGRLVANRRYEKEGGKLLAHYAELYGAQIVDLEMPEGTVVRAIKLTPEVRETIRREGVQLGAVNPGALGGLAAAGGAGAAAIFLGNQEVDSEMERRRREQERSRRENR